MSGWSSHFSFAVLYHAWTRISASQGVSPYPTYPLGDPVSFSIFIGWGMVSPEIFINPLGSPNRTLAMDRASSVFPTPVGHASMTAPRDHWSLYTLNSPLIMVSMRSFFAAS